MKTFYYECSADGNPPYELKERFRTLTVKELKEVLSRHPDDMPCLAYWEGLFVPIRLEQTYYKTQYREEETVEFIYVDEVDEISIKPKCDCLIFCVDED